MASEMTITVANDEINIVADGNGKDLVRGIAASIIYTAQKNNITTDEVFKALNGLIDENDYEVTKFEEG